MSCVLPEDLLVDILCERLKVCVGGEKETFLLQKTGSEVQPGEEQEEEICPCCWRILDCVQGTLGEAADALSWQSLRTDPSWSYLMPLEQG